MACLAEKEPDSVLGHPRGKIPSQWVAMARTRAELGRIAGDRRWHPCHTDRHRVWSDDYSSPISVLKLG
jgi:hypothetical protein